MNQKHKNLTKVVYKGSTWEQARPKINMAFLNAGIVSCELKYPGCGYNWPKTFAHSLRRKKIVTKQQMEEVIWACQKCHTKCDALDPAETYKLIRKIIRSRPKPVKSIYEKSTKKNGNSGRFPRIPKGKQHKTGNES